MIRRIPGPHDVPQHAVGVVQPDRRVDDIAQRHGGVDVVVVPVGQHDRRHPTAVDGVDDRLVIVRGVEDDDLAFVADEPDVVGDLPLAAIESEDAVRRDELDGHQSTTTERSTSPRSILWNASSTSSSLICSLTNRSRSRRPCR